MVECGKNLRKGESQMIYVSKIKPNTPNISAKGLATTQFLPNKSRDTGSCHYSPWLDH